MGIPSILLHKTLHSTSCYSAPQEHFFIFYNAEVLLLLDFFLIFLGDEVNLVPGFLGISSHCILEVFYLPGFFVFYPVALLLGIFDFVSYSTEVNLLPGFLSI